MQFLGRFHPSVVLRTPDHLGWVLLQQFFVKGFFGIKFLLAARWLGPEMFGLVGVALAALAIVESLADTGMNQAVIQRQHAITPDEAGAVWTLQGARGFLILLILLFAAPLIAGLFGIHSAASLIMLAAVLPLVRNLINPGYILLQRNRDFRSFALVESLAAAMDLIVSIICLRSGLGPASVLLGTLAADVSRSALSWSTFRMILRPNLRWKEIGGLGRYGLWIWSTSVLTVLLNQFDKVVVARWLGATNFGIYQTSSRLAQLGISDIALAAGQYLFPTLSRLHHEHADAGRAYFKRALLKMAVISGALSLLLAAGASLLIEAVLGSAWLSAVPVLRIQCLSMWIGALIAVCVAFLRASGRPQCVTHASLIQLFVLVLPSYSVINRFGVIGMAWLVSVALALACLYMYRQAVIRSSQCA